jgi:hypothetical protein
MTDISVLEHWNSRKALVTIDIARTALAVLVEAAL